MKDIKIKIIAKRGNKDCERGHKVGEEYIIKDGKTPEGLCCSAFNSIWPFAKVLLVTQDKKYEGTVICPDPDTCLEFRLELVD
jgi:uncharacterized repeat protein (TIGR04076 family)